jgi:hypothetical protein
LVLPHFREHVAQLVDTKKNKPPEISSEKIRKNQNPSKLPKKIREFRGFFK